MYNYFKVINVHFRDNLKRLRVEKGLSQQELADLSGMSKNHISRMENGGQDNPNIRTVVAIASALDVTVDDLIFGEAAKVNASQIVNKIEQLSDKDQESIKEMIKAWIGYSLSKSIE